MKDCSKRFLLLIFASSLLVSTCVSYCPLAYAGESSQSKDKRTIRVTTGIEQVQGWERGLIQGNPNLARWHWDPIYSYKQGYATVSPEIPKPGNLRTSNKVTGSPGKGAYNYVVPPQQDSRPNHIPFSPQALAEVQARYSQPVKPQPQTNQPMHDEKVSASLVNKQTQAKVLSPTTIATYGQLYSRQEKSDTGLKYSAQKASVYGQLIDTRTTAIKQYSKRSKGH